MEAANNDKSYTLSRRLGTLEAMAAGVGLNRLIKDFFLLAAMRGEFCDESNPEFRSWIDAMDHLMKAQDMIARIEGAHGH